MFATERKRVLSLAAVSSIVWACVMWTAPHALADPLDGVSDTASGAVSDASDAASDATSDAGDAASDTTPDAGDAASGAAGDASDAVDGATDTVGDAVGDAADTVDEATGGATEVVTDPVEDVVGEAEETIDETTEDATETVGGVIDGATDPGNVLPGGGGGSTQPGGSGGSDSGVESGPDTDTGQADNGSSRSGNLRPGNKSDSRQTGGGASTAGAAPDALADPAKHWAMAVVGLRNESAAGGEEAARDTDRAGARSRNLLDAFGQVTTQPAAAAVGVMTEAASSQGETAGPFEAILQRAAEATRQLAFPLALTMMVVVFLGIQGRFDRKDPKLSMAPVDSDQDALYFE